MSKIEQELHDLVSSPEYYSALQDEVIQARRAYEITTKRWFRACQKLQQGSSRYLGKTINEWRQQADRDYTAFCDAYRKYHANHQVYHIGWCIPLQY